MQGWGRSKKRVRKMELIGYVIAETAINCIFVTIGIICVLIIGRCLEFIRDLWHKLARGR